MTPEYDRPVILSGGRKVDFSGYMGTGTAPPERTPEEIERQRIEHEQWQSERAAKWDAYLDTIRAKTDAELVKDAEDENDCDYDAGGPNTDELIRRFKIYAERQKKERHDDTPTPST